MGTGVGDWDGWGRRDSEGEIGGTAPEERILQPRKRRRGGANVEWGLEIMRFTRAMRT